MLTMLKGGQCVGEAGEGDERTPIGVLLEGHLGLDTKGGEELMGSEKNIIVKLIR